MADDLVSVVVPLRNAGAFIADTLARLLAERHALEVLVVDDGSTDDSLAQVARFRDPRLQVLTSPGRGIAACLNEGLARARGTILMRCDADDLYTPGRIAEQARWLQRHAEYDAVCGAFSTMDLRGRLVSDLVSGIGRHPQEITSEIRQGYLRTSLCTYAMRASLVSRTGSLRTYFESAEDLDYQYRLAEAGRIYYLPRNWYVWRVHSASTTHGNAARREFFASAAREFQRQRSQGGGRDDLQQGDPPLPPRLLDDESGVVAAADHVQHLLLWRAWHEHAAGDKAQAVKTGLRALRTNPARLGIWKSIAALAIKPAGQRLD
jgi:glycosyltransferase involved in cell wall biosynthesis